MFCVCTLIDCVVDFFFFKQKTAYEMRISDWSSDVCSSDLFQLWVRAWPRWLSLVGWVARKADQPLDALRPHPPSSSERGKPTISPDGRDHSEFRLERHSQPGR